ncbi:MAG: KEOPS complex subunit Pcc1 [Candidatus Bathyarchaeota archaeon]|nr:KEOPS complex subunit Pcc1 [Candidatus Bathyarchaeota archaeon]
MSTSAKAAVRLKFDSEKQLTTLIAALTPEAKTPATRRANVKLDVEGCYLFLSVEAEDTVALRATLNAYLRWINSTINVIDALREV